MSTTTADRHRELARSGLLSREVGNVFYGATTHTGNGLLNEALRDHSGNVARKAASLTIMALISSGDLDPNFDQRLASGIVADTEELGRSLNA
jgi:hypothetical protein